MTAMRLILSFVLGAVVAGGAAWFAFGGGSTDDDWADDGEQGVASVAASPASASRHVSDGAPNGAERLFALDSENRDLEVEIAKLEARLTEIQPPPTDPEAFRFGLPDKTQAFDQADWPKLADHATALTELLDGMKDRIVAGEEPTGKEYQDIIEQNTPLALFAVAFGGEMEDTNANSAYTHPAVLANLIRAALLQAGDPLTGHQEIAIKTLGDAWVGEMRRVRTALPPGAPELARTVAEVDAKLRFLASAKNVLTPEQRGILFHPETEGRLQLDLLSPALVYVLSFPVEATDREDMETKLVEHLFAQAGVEVEDLSPYAWIGRQWVDEIPGAAVPQSPRSVDLRFPHVDQVQAKARAQAAATERILAMGGLGEEDAQSLREVEALLLPFVLIEE